MIPHISQNDTYFYTEGKIGIASKPFQMYMFQVVCYKLQQLFTRSVCHIGIILIACFTTQRPPVLPPGSPPGVVGQEFESVEIIHAKRPSHTVRRCTPAMGRSDAAAM